MNPLCPKCGSLKTTDPAKDNFSTCLDCGFQFKFDLLEINEAADVPKEADPRREGIAVAIVQGLMSNPKWLDESFEAKHIAKMAVMNADALIAELDK
jgi:hypothetical protein